MTGLPELERALDFLLQQGREAPQSTPPTPESELVARLWTAAERLNRSLPGNDLAELYAQAAATIERLHSAHETLFEAIKHGAEVHRAWLREAIDNHFSGKPVPPPRAANPSAHEQGRREGIERVVELCIERAEQACRYALKHQNFFSDDDSDYVSGWQVAAEVCEKAIAENVRKHIQDDIRALSSAPPGENPDEGHPHLIGGEFQSDKYPTCPRGKVPLSVKDKTAQDLLWEYAQRRRAVDAEFASDLEIALKAKGYDPAAPRLPCPAIDQIILLLENLRNDNAQLRMGVLHYEALYRESTGEKGRT